MWVSCILKAISVSSSGVGGSKIGSFPIAVIIGPLTTICMHRPILSKAGTVSVLPLNLGPCPWRGVDVVVHATPPKFNRRDDVKSTLPCLEHHLPRFVKNWGSIYKY